MIGNHVKVKVVKNKIAPPFKEAEFDIMFGQGISKEGDILDLAAKENIVEKSGAWYAYNGSKIGQGRENAKIYLKEHPEICEEIDHKVREHYGLLGETAVQEPEKGSGDKKALKPLKSKEKKGDAAEKPAGTPESPKEPDVGLGILEETAKEEE